MALILSGSDGLSDVDGSAATPAIRGTDANTGIFFPAADTIAFSEGGTESMRLTSTGYVGIGNTSPVTNLSIGNGGGGNDLGVMLSRGATTNFYQAYDGTKTFIGGTDSSNDYVKIGSLSSHPVGFVTGNAERARFNTTGAFVFAGGTTTANGIGITFPATQSASTNANTLDDYEEGTWTPSDGSGAGLVFTVNSATYLKVGKLVFVNMYLIYPATASTASAAIAGLPFVAQSLGYSYLAGRVQNNIGNGAVWQVSQASSVMASNPATNSGFAYTNVDYSGSFILFSGCYVSAN